ncbi:hypothetical protein [Thauera sp.]|uniref:hypothetical protein n=1 Tax=Thauera sp. TaxID=1905334 RepID=UPI0039E575D7
MISFKYARTRQFPDNPHPARHVPSWKQEFNCTLQPQDGSTLIPGEMARLKKWHLASGLFSRKARQCKQSKPLREKINSPATWK